MRRDPRTALMGAAVCLAGLVATGVLALLVPVARARDAVTLQGFNALNDGRISALADHVAHLCDPIPYAGFGAAIVLVALVRRRARTAVAVALVLLAAPLTSELLKPILATSRTEEWLGAGQIRAAAWPSGHATAAMTLALCAVLVAPNRVRPFVAAVGGILAIGVSYSVLVLAWHFPSDVLGGFFVAGLYVSLAVAALLATLERPSRLVGSAAPRVTPVLMWPSIVGALVIVVAVAVVGPDRLAGFAADRPTFVVGALAIALVGVGLAAVLARVLALGRR